MYGKMNLECCILIIKRFTFPANLMNNIFNFLYWYKELNLPLCTVSIDPFLTHIHRNTLMMDIFCSQYQVFAI